MKPNSVSLVIATYNWKEALKLTLLSVFSQTVLPEEIIIADDGSRDDTRMMIDGMRSKTRIPIKHIWHKDEGFQLAKIRNKGIAEASGEYIIQIDGDVILDSHFIQDHLELAETGYFVCGSRVMVLPNITKQILEKGTITIQRNGIEIGYILNGLRSKILRTLLAKRYAKDIVHMRGCNFAFWKHDFISVNGYNEDLSGWGHEDSELACRLYSTGVQKKFLKMGGVLFHLWHGESSKANSQQHLYMLNKVICEKQKWTPNGIYKYLNG